MQNNSNNIMSPLPATPNINPQPPTAAEATQPGVTTTSAAPGVAPGAVPGATPITGTAVTPTKSRGSLVETIILIVVSLIAATFIGLFIWMFVMYDSASTDVDGQIKAAVNDAEAKLTTELQTQFTEAEKTPNTHFTGPAEYGSLKFDYPKTWSVYIAQDSADGGDYVAYFTPGGVLPVNNTNMNALRLSIVGKSISAITKTYDNNVKKGLLSLSVREIGGESANYYQGELPGSKFRGRAVVFKLRDKTVTLQTDAETFANDFDALLKTITFSQ